MLRRRDPARNEVLRKEGLRKAAARRRNPVRAVQGGVQNPVSRRNKNMSREHEYRIIDSLCRLHEDLYQVEDAMLRSAVGQFRLAKIRTTAVAASAVASFLIVLPIILTVTDLDWDDLPAIWGCFVSVLLFVLLGYQVHEAKATARKLRMSEEFYKRTPLERRFDYILEQINANGVRIRALDDVIEELEETLSTSSDPHRARVKDRINRWHEIRNECRKEIKAIVDDSELPHGQPLEPR